MLINKDLPEKPTKRSLTKNECHVNKLGNQRHSAVPKTGLVPEFNLRFFYFKGTVQMPKSIFSNLLSDDLQCYLNHINCDYVVNM
jgi:hypothetical protein